MNKSKKCYVAFLDIMGFASFVENETPEKVENILSEFINSPIPGGDTLNYNILSDTIIISVSLELDSGEPKHCMQIQQELQILLMTVTHIQKSSIIGYSGLPVRGGIAIGDFFIDNEKNIMFGKGLIAAHKIESSLAIYPRIIVDSEILVGMKKTGDRSYPIKRDFDGLFHVNYLCTLEPTNDGTLMGVYRDWLKKHRDYIIKNLADEKNIKIATKYHWMEAYHNWFCTGYDEYKEYLIGEEEPSKV